MAESLDEPGVAECGLPPVRASGSLPALAGEADPVGRLAAVEVATLTLPSPALAAFARGYSPIGAEMSTAHTWATRAASSRLSSPVPDRTSTATSPGAG